MQPFIVNGWEADQKGAFYKLAVMILNISNLKAVKMELDADISTHSQTQNVKGHQANQSMLFRGLKSTAWSINHVARVPVRRVLLFQILAVFGTILCRTPLLVDGLARAGEGRSHLLFGAGDDSSDEVVLQGLPYTATLKRPSTSPLQLLRNEELEEILTLKLKLLRSKASAFRVFINLPEANENTPVTCSEFGGLYFHEPRRVKNPDYEYQETIVRLGIGDIIKDLGLVEQPSILVTIVPCGADKGFPIVLKSAGIELE